MLYDPSPEKFSLLYDSSACRENDVTLLFAGGRVLLRTDGAGRLPLWKEVVGLGCPVRHAFSFEGKRYFLGLPGAQAQPPAGLQWQSVREFRHMRPVRDGFALSTAYHLACWYGTHRFCGACGQPLEPAPVERALHCPGCGLTVYPVISPAITTAILDGDRIVLATNAHGEFRHYSLIAGYVEVGETMEQAVHREVMEEVGLRVRNLRYVGCQPWGLSQTLMLGFAAELEGDDRITRQESELSDARWFRREELEAVSEPASLSFEMIERFRQGRL